MPQKQSLNSYFINPEDQREKIRLNRQGRMFTKVAGFFSSRVDIRKIHKILDIGCGPGEWPLDLAKMHPDKEILGVDISERMIEFAQAQAIADDVKNATFQCMDATQYPLPFSSESFDFIHARLIIGFMTLDMWPKLLAECYRILKPGGWIKLTESDVVSTTNSVSLEEYTSYITRALYETKRLTSPYARGIFVYLPQFLKHANFTQIEKTDYVTNYSAGTEDQVITTDGYLQLFTIFSPFLVRSGVVTTEEIQRIAEEARRDMASEDFIAGGFISSTYGQKKEL